jgi:hypothetical protein
MMRVSRELSTYRLDLVGVSLAPHRQKNKNISVDSELGPINWVHVFFTQENHISS